MSTRLPVLLSVAALSLFTAACGNDETETATAGETTEQQSTPEPTATPDSENIGRSGRFGGEGQRGRSMVMRAQQR